MQTVRALALALTASVFPLAAFAQAPCTAPGNAAQLEATIGAGLNQFRQSQSLGPLRADDRLAAAALVQACDMAVNQNYTHRGTDGSSSEVRMRRQGYHDCLAAENLAWGFPDPNQIINGWINSPGHRRNMLLDNVRDYGVAVAIGAQGPVWVLVIARPC